MPGSEFANPGLRAVYGHTAGQGRHLKGLSQATKKGARPPDDQTKFSRYRA